MAAALTREYAEPETLRGAGARPVPAVARDREALRAREGRRRFAREAARRLPRRPTGASRSSGSSKRSDPDISERGGAGSPALRAEPGSRLDGRRRLLDAKTVKEVKKSHLNYVVSGLEVGAIGGLPPGQHPRVVAFVKNQGLGFAIPYLHTAGGAHDYIPDFIVRLDNGVHLILETKGHDELEEVKAQAAERWVARRQRRRQLRRMALRRGT